jgi:hypothetical protein
MITINPQFITDANGKKISAILSISEFKSLVEELDELEDIRLYDESKNDKEASVSKARAIEMIAEERKNQR